MLPTNGNVEALWDPVITLTCPALPTYSHHGHHLLGAAILPVADTIPIPPPHKELHAMQSLAVVKLFAVCAMLRNITMSAFLSSLSSFFHDELGHHLSL